MGNIDFSKYKDIQPYMFIPFVKDTIVDMSYHPKWNIPDKIGITVAPVGAFFKRDQNPYQPYTTDEIIKESIEAVEAGACGVHIHVRDKNGNPSDDRQMTEKVIKALRDKFGENVYSYSCIISGIDLPPGAWTFRFEAKDSYGISTNVLYGSEKIWMIGSGMEIMSGFSLTTLTAGTIPLIGFITAIPMTKHQWIASAIAIGTTLYSVVQLMLASISFCESKNAGALLGFSIGLAFSCLAIMNAYKNFFLKFSLP